MKTWRTTLLLLAAMSFLCMITGGLYEHVTMIPRWSAAPPVSLSMFKGPYGVNMGLFWQSIHPITLILFAAALILNWKTPRRSLILVPFIAYVLMLVVTFIFFVPELISIIKTPLADTPDAELTSRAGRWETQSLFRLFIMLPMGAILLLSLTKPASFDQSAGA